MADERPTSAPQPALSAAPGEPYCGACGYLLAGAVGTAVCPECGRPLVEVLQRGRPRLGKVKRRRYESGAHFMGLPAVSIALGPDEDGNAGRARGWIAVGDTAVGGVAIGNGFAVGIVAIGGGASAGVVSIGGGAGLGVLAGLGGGVGIGGLAMGGMGAGGVSVGGAAFGFAALGGGAVGYYAKGGGAAGVHVVSGSRSDPGAVAFFDSIAWLIGAGTSGASLLTLALWIVILGAFVAAPIVALAIRADAGARETPA